MNKKKNVSSIRGSEALDRALAGSESAKVARIVRSLPAETPSMAWRSALNERILADARRRKSRRFWARIWMPAAGVGTSAAIAASVFFLWLGGPGPETGGQEASLEASMVMIHRDNVRFSELAGSGLSESDANLPKQGSGPNDGWKESDLEAM